ncbi:MAG: tetratricopeptide repeat protein [Betaproteobacteria bacterium]
MGDALTRLARVLATRGRYEEARALLGEAWPLLQSAGSAKALGVHFAAVGFLKVQTGDLPGARSDYLQAVTEYRRAAATVPALVMLGNLGNIAWAQGDLDRAAHAYAESIEMLDASPSTRKTALALAYCNYCGVLTEMGRLDEALEAARKGLPLFQNSEQHWLNGGPFRATRRARGRRRGRGASRRLFRCHDRRQGSGATGQRSTRSCAPAGDPRATAVAGAHG